MQKSIRILFIFAFMAVFSEYLNAQVFLRIGNYRPTGEFGFVMKPTVSFEGGLAGTINEDNKWRTMASLSFMRMTPRMDTFPTVTTMTTGSGTTILPGQQSFSKYNIILLSVGFDYPFYYTDQLAIYGGFDLQAGGATVEYYENVPTYKQFTYSGGGVIAGGRFRLGFDYYINDNWGLFASATRHIFLITEPAAISAANDYGIGIRYIRD